MYLRTNLSQFHYELPYNDYINYTIIVDNKGDITDHDLLDQLKLDCQELYIQLYDFVQKLDL